MGVGIAGQLIQEHKDVVLIEPNPEIAQRAADRLDCMVIRGEGNSAEILRRAGVERAAFFIAVTDSDEVNMIACGLVSGQFPGPATIARVRNLRYSGTKVSEKSFLGIDYVVNPEIEAARGIINTVERGAVSDVMLFQNSRLQIRPVPVGPDSFLRNKTIEVVAKALDVSFLVALLSRKEEYVIPSGDTEIREGDTLYVAATEDSHDRFFKRIGNPRRDIRRIVIVGGGQITEHLVERLLDGRGRDKRGVMRLFGAMGARRKRNIRIVEKNPDRCDALAQRFPDALILRADISDEGIFEEEHLSASDLIIAATENQELNIVTAIYAKTFGIPRAVVLVQGGNYVRIASHLGIDAPVSTKSAMVSSILKYVRRGNVKSIHSISDGKVEVLEFDVDESSAAVGRAIRDIRLPRESLIVAASRRGKDELPMGDYVVEAGDQVIVIAQKGAIARVEQVFTARS